MGIPQCWRIYHLLSQTSVLLTFKFVFYIPLWGTLKLLYHLSNTRPENVTVLLSCANVRGKKDSALDTMPHTFTGGISFQPGAIAFETGRRAQRLHRIANSRLEPARNSPDIIAIGDNSWKGSHVSCLESPHSEHHSISSLSNVLNKAWTSLNQNKKTFGIKRNNQISFNFTPFVETHALHQNHRAGRWDLGGLRGEGSGGRLSPCQCPVSAHCRQQHDAAPQSRRHLGGETWLEESRAATNHSWGLPGRHASVTSWVLSSLCLKPCLSSDVTRLLTS